MANNNQKNNSKDPQSDLPLSAIGAFNAFLTSFVEGKSYVLNNVIQDLFDRDNLNKTYEEYYEKSLVGDKDKSFDKVIIDLKERDNVMRETMIDIINHAVWLWALPNNKKAPWVGMELKKRKKGSSHNDTPKYNDDLRKIKGVAGGGRDYIQYKTKGVRFILFLFTKICESNCESANDAKEVIENNYKNFQDYPEGVKNLLLHLCDPNKYEPIAATSDKIKIVKAFWDSIDVERPVDEKAAITNLDDTVIKIKKMFSGENPNFSFYEHSLPLLWKGESDSDLSLVQQLEYKKAMILYGPPGTSKTYTAKELAINIIFRDLMKNHKEDAIRLLKQGSLKDLLKGRVKELQFHINYTYEDFIAGQTIEKNNVKTRKGLIFDVVKNSEEALKIQADEKPIVIDKVPYVVILDEINRTDISRVFGELLSAIENRGEAVDLMLPDPRKKNNVKLQLIIPENIYFIGTMNEIDFSLERVDFALRRRFIWELHDYNKETLVDIIDYRLNEAIDKNIMNDYDDISATDIEEFRTNCNKLNEKVTEVMGGAYHIGHTFFAEIANIYIKLKENNTTDPWKNAKWLLWQISIKPTLEAYCGTMDKGDKDKYLKGDSGDFYDAFFK